MADTVNSIRFFKPSGEPVPISGEKVVKVGSHPDMGGTVLFMEDDQIIHTNLPYMMTLDQEAVEDLTGDLDIEGEE